MNTIKPLFLIAIVLPLVVIGCKGSDTAKDKVYDIKGKVVAVDTDKKTVKLDHEAIPGLMGAMTMDFPVEDLKVLEGIKAGDEVQGRLKVQDSNRTIVELKKR